MRTLTVTDLGGAVDVVDGENVPEAVQEHFSQSRNQLSCGDQNIHTFAPANTHTVTSRDSSDSTRSLHNRYTVTILTWTGSVGGI